MAKQYSKKVKSTQKKRKKIAKEKKSKIVKSKPKAKKLKLKSDQKPKKEDITIPEKKIQKDHHKFELKSAFKLKDIVAKVMLLKNGNYGALDEKGEFIVFSIDKDNKLKEEVSFYIPGSNYFGQLNNGILIFNGFDTISFWELKDKNLNKVGEYDTIFKLVTYSMEPIGDNFCAISGPNNIIELIEFNKNKKIKVNFLDYKKYKKGKKSQKLIFDFSSEIKIDFSQEIIGCLYYQKNKKKLLATHCTENMLRIWDCDIKKNKYELFKEIKDISSFTGRVIHELHNKIIIGGKGCIVMINKDSYELEDFIPLGFSNFDIFSMEVINYYNFKEFVVCGLRNGNILGIDIEKKNVEFVKKKINNTGKDNEMTIKEGHISFYGELVSYILKVENKNMILVCSHDHTLKLVEY